MSALFKVRVLEKSENNVELEVLQTHPDAGTWDAFERRYLLSAVAQPAFDGDGWPPAASAPLGEAIGSWSDLADCGMEEVEPFFTVATHVLRDVYNDANVAARMAEAGLSGTLMTKDVPKVCGRMRVKLEAKDPRWMQHFQPGAEWEIA